MTVVVGIRCRDHSAVVGTDSATTLDTDQYKTVLQPLRKNIYVIDEKLIVAGTGQIGLLQRFVEILKKLQLENKFQEKGAIEVGKMITRETIKDFRYTDAQVSSFGALTLVPIANRAEIIEFSTADFRPEVKDESNWYVSMGIGQSIADPLLGFVRATFWDDGPPNLVEGILVTAMVIKLTCQMGLVGVSEPMQMAILSSIGKQGELQARQLTDEELLEYDRNVRELLDYFRDFRNKVAPASTLAEPQPVPELSSH